MSRIFLTVGVLLILIVAGFAFIGPLWNVPAESKAEITGEAASAEPAHDFTLDTLTGETVTLSRLRGQWVVVNFWAAWCQPCVKEMPYLQQLAQERNLVVLGVNFNESPDTVTAFVAQHNLTFPILMNPDDITLLVYQVRGLPRTFVIAPDGTIALHLIGEIDPEKFNTWLDGHQVGEPETLSP